MALVVYAVLSLTVVRMVPVALALLGSGLDVRTVLFVGWFGPRGLASVVFLLLAVEELGETPVVAPVLAAITFTVLMSVVLHGVSAGPLVRRYAVSEAGGRTGRRPPITSRRTRVTRNRASATGRPGGVRPPRARTPHRLHGSPPRAW